MDVGAYACSQFGCCGQVGAPIAAAFSNDFAFAFDAGCFEVNEAGLELVLFRGLAPIEDHIFKLLSLLNAVEGFAHSRGYGDGVMAGSVAR